MNFLVFRQLQILPFYSKKLIDQHSASADKGVLTKIDVLIGSGKKAIASNKVNVHYTGWLFNKSAPRECSELPRFVSLKSVLSCLKNKGKKFDSSRDRPGNFKFKLGQDRSSKVGIKACKV